MDPFTKLVLVRVTAIAFFLLLMYALHRVHGVSIKRQWQLFKALNKRIGSGMMAVFQEEHQGRNDRRVRDQHDALCQEVSGADRALRIMMEASRNDREASAWVTPKSLAEVSAEQAKAIMALRIFLGRLTPPQASSIACATADDCLYQIDTSALYEFLCQESEAADDASDSEIIGHGDRFQATVQRLYRASCQDG